MEQMPATANSVTNSNSNQLTVLSTPDSQSCSALAGLKPPLNTKGQPPDCLDAISSPKPNQVGTVLLYGIPIVSLYIESQERLCLAQISNTLLKTFSYNEIHNRRVALGITCVQCTPVQLEILRRAGAMPVSSRRCGMITRREAERLCKSFLGDNAPPRLPDDFAFSVFHECAWGCRGAFLPSRYNSSRAKCIKCSYCAMFFSPNKFIFHSHRIGPSDKYIQPDAANFNSWRRHMKLSGNPPEQITHAWEDVKAMFNGGTRKRVIANSMSSSGGALSLSKRPKKETLLSSPTGGEAKPASRPGSSHAANTSNQRIVVSSPSPQLPFPRNYMVDYMWQAHHKKLAAVPFSNYSLPWIKTPTSLIFDDPQIAGQPSLDPISPFIQQANGRAVAAGNILENKVLSTLYNKSAFRPVLQTNCRRSLAQYNNLALNKVAAVVKSLSPDGSASGSPADSAKMHIIKDCVSSDDEMVDIETTEEEHSSTIAAKPRVKLLSGCALSADEDSSAKSRPSSPPIEIDNSDDQFEWNVSLKNETGDKDEHTSRISPATSMTSGSVGSPTPSDRYVRQLDGAVKSTPPPLLSPGLVALNGRKAIPMTTAAAVAIASAFCQRHTQSPSLSGAYPTELIPSHLHAPAMPRLHSAQEHTASQMFESYANNPVVAGSTEFWSIARLSYDHPLPYQKQNDVNKQFQAFRSHGHEAPETGGVG